MKRLVAFTILFTLHTVLTIISPFWATVTVFTEALPAPCRTVLNTDRLGMLVKYYATRRFEEILALADLPGASGWEERLIIAKSYEKTGNFAESNRLYRELCRQEPELAQLCRYFIARNFENLDDPARAVKWYGRLLSKARRTESPVFDDRAMELAALNRLYHLSLGNDEFEKTLERYGPFYPAARYHLFSLSLQKGEPLPAAEQAYELLHADEEPFLSLVVQDLMQDARVIGHLKEMNFSVHSLFTLALERGLYREALDISHLLPESDEVLEKRAYAYYKLGDYETAARFFDEHHTRTGATDSLLRNALSYFNLGRFDESEESLNRYLSLVREWPGTQAMDEDAAYLEVLLTLQKSGYTESLQKVHDFVMQYSTHEFSDYLVTRVFYNAFTAGLRDEAVRFLLEVKPYLASSYYRAWASYVLGLFYDALLLQDAAQLQPGSYYAFRARELLADAGANPIDGSEKRPFDETGRELESFLHTLICLGLYNELEEILVPGLPLSQAQDRMKYQYILSHVSYVRGEPHEGIRLAENVLEAVAPQSILDLPRELLVLLYPRVYGDVIGELLSREPKKFHYHLVLALMREESRYNRSARSPQGALGLMQLIPATASWILNRELSTQELTNPAINIEAAVAYLDYLFDRFETLEYAVASYNGGPNTVARWIRTNPELSVEKFIEEIPYGETRNFVKRVYTSYMMYNYLYGDPSAVRGFDDDSLN